jgi:hypothetical protein
MEIQKNPIECAFHVSTDNGNAVCMETDVINELQIFAKKIKKLNVHNEKDTIKELKKIYDCNSESCLLTKTEIIDVIGHDKASEQLTNRFKPDGPLNKNTWFSNINIDNVLYQIEKKYTNKKFKHIPFQMRDFQETNSALATIDFVNEYQNGVRCFGVVFNDDKSTGGGSHWTAMFGDFSKEPFTIEHFNSSGAGPKNEMREWMIKTKHKLEKGLKKKVEVKEVSKIQHQMGNSACGPYSIYYIISRLENVPYTSFEKQRIPDEYMDEFRFYLFRNIKN